MPVIGCGAEDVRRNVKNVRHQQLHSAVDDKENGRQQLRSLSDVENARRQ